MNDSDATVKLVVDGHEIQAKPGEMIIAAAEKAGVLIPRFCYHPRLEPVGVCRMCLVEVKGPRGFSLQPACYLPVAEGMEVVTNSDKAKKAQDGVLEYLLANHPLDCPVCDKGGECPLQDQTFVYGPGESRFVEEKRHYPKPIPISKLVYLDRERCIQCDRCTRFADDVAGEALINFIGRGGSIQVNTFPDKPFSSYFSGNTVQICPVGALTATPYRFKARPWDLEQVESTCVGCSVGCQIVVQSSENELVRYLGLDSEAVNHSWLCDKGRFGFESVNSSDRLGTPTIRNGTAAKEASWTEAMAKLAEPLNRARKRPESIAIIGGAHLANEDLYVWSKLAKSIFGTDSVDAQLGDGLDPRLLTRTNRATIADAVGAEVLVLLSGDIREELPVLFLRLREAAISNGLKIVELTHAATSLTPNAAASIVVSPGQVEATVRSLVEQSGQEPSDPSIAAAKAIIAGADPTRIVVLAGRMNQAGSPLDQERAIATLIDAKPGSKLLSGLRRANVNGAIDMGFVPGHLPGRCALTEGSKELIDAWKQVPTQIGRSTPEILAAAANGEIDVLFLLGADPISDAPDPELAERALARVGTVVSVETLPNASTRFASIILPAAAFTERMGSTTNVESRISLLGQKLVSFGLSRPEWMIAVEIAAAIGEDLGFESMHDVWRELSLVSPLHRGLSLQALGSPGTREGVLVPVRRSRVSIASNRSLDPVATPGIISVEHSGPPSSSGTGRGSDAYPGIEANASAVESVDSRISGDLLDLLATPNEVAPIGSDDLVPVLRRRLFDGGTMLVRSKNLTELAPAPRVTVGGSTAASMGFAAGSKVTLSNGTSELPDLELVVDRGVADGVVVVDLDGESGLTRRVLQGENLRLTIKLESV